MARHALPKSNNTSILVVLTLLAALLVPLSSPNPSMANTSVDFSGEYLNFDRDTMQVLNGSILTTPVTGTVVLYPNAGVIEGVSVDVTVEITAVIDLNNPNEFTWDQPSSGQFNNVTLNQSQKDLVILDMENWDVVFRYSFWESGTVVYANSNVSGVAVELQNLVINTYDLDYDQWVAFSSFQAYQINNVDPVNVSLMAGTSLVRFLGNNDNGNGFENDDSFTKGRARVLYDQVRTVDVRVNAPGGSLYGLQFGAGVAWSTFDTFANQFNQAPVSTDTSRYLVPGLNTSLNPEDFGDYSDPDNNPFVDLKIESSADIGGLRYFDGTNTVSPAAGSTVSVTAVSLGRLSFNLPTATAATVSFRVGDGLTYSPTVYSLNLLPATETQFITFPAAGGIVNPKSGAFSSSATASSQLNVTLTSNTPDVCSTNGLDIEPEIVSVRSVCSVTATQPGNAQFASAVPVTRTFYFSDQEIDFPAISDELFVSGAALSSSATANSTLPVTLTALTPGVCTVSGLDIQHVAIGTCTVRADAAAGSTGSTPVSYLAAFPVFRSFNLTAAPTFNLTYDANTGTGTAPSDLSGVSSVTIGTGSLLKSGFDFSGWNTEADGSGTDFATGSAVTLTANLSLFAKWTATITFDSQGGSAEADQTYVYGQTAITLPTPDRSGFAFGGWATTPTGQALGATYSSGSATLYALWTAPSGGSLDVPPLGPTITLITPRVVTTTGGELIRVEGRRLGTGDYVTIGGVIVPLESSSTKHFTFRMPALSVRSWDMIYTHDGGGKLTYIQAIEVIASAPVLDAGTGSGAGESDATNSGVAQPSPWRAIGVASHFGPGSPVINKAVRDGVVQMLRKYARFATKIECTGFTMGPSVLSVDEKLSLDRAHNVCNLIKKLRPRLTVVTYQGRQELKLGGEVRRVEVLFTRD